MTRMPDSADTRREGGAAGSDVPSPRTTSALFGHADAERTLLDAYRSGRVPHAWLIGGPPGIGKATLAYRFARFALAHPDPATPAVQGAASLTLAAEHPVARRVGAQAHGNLLVIERSEGDNGKLRSMIAVDDVRRTVGFFGATAGEAGWRVAIVDAVDELNAAGANALLKVLEEPPSRTLLLLVSHAPGRVLATICSRCRRLLLRSLAADDVALAAAAALGRDPGEPELRAAAEAADGSVARALALLDGATLALRQRVGELLGRLPATDPRALHALGEALAGGDPQTLATFIDAVDGWLSARLAAGGRARLVQVAEAWEKVNRAAREVEIYNLDRKPLVFSVFGWLAEAVRG
jgi:DNA polymerase-3 subunit delta'